MISNSLLVKHFVILFFSLLFGYVGFKLAPSFPVYDAFRTQAESQLHQYIYFHIYFFVAFSAVLGALVAGKFLGMKLESVFLSPFILYFVISLVALFKQGFLIQFGALSVVAMSIGGFCAIGVFVTILALISNIVIFNKEK